MKAESLYGLCRPLWNQNPKNLIQKMEESQLEFYLSDPLFLSAINNLKSTDLWMVMGDHPQKTIFNFIINRISNGKPIPYIHRFSNHLDLKQTDPKEDKSFLRLEHILKTRLFQTTFFLVEDLDPRFLGLGETRLITDIFGPFTRSRKIDQLVKIYGQLLEPGGDLFIKTLDRIQFLNENSKMNIDIYEFFKTYVRGFTLVSAPARTKNSIISIHLQRNTDPVEVSPTVPLRQIEYYGIPSTLYRVVK